MGESQARHLLSKTLQSVPKDHPVLQYFQELDSSPKNDYKDFLCHIVLTEKIGLYEDLSSYAADMADNVCDKATWIRSLHNDFTVEDLTYITTDWEEFVEGFIKDDYSLFLDISDIAPDDEDRTKYQAEMGPQSLTMTKLHDETKQYLSGNSRQCPRFLEAQLQTKLESSTGSASSGIEGTGEIAISLSISNPSDPHSSHLVSRKFKFQNRATLNVRVEEAVDFLRENVDKFTKLGSQNITETRPKGYPSRKGDKPRDSQAPTRKCRPTESEGDVKALGPQISLLKSRLEEKIGNIEITKDDFAKTLRDLYKSRAGPGSKASEIPQGRLERSKDILTAEKLIVRTATVRLWLRKLEMYCLDYQESISARLGPPSNQRAAHMVISVICWVGEGSGGPQCSYILILLSGTCILTLASDLG